MKSKLVCLSEQALLGGVDCFHHFEFDNQFLSPSLSDRLGHLAFSTYTRVFNKQQAHPPDPLLHRSMFERDFITYSLVQFQLFMGGSQAFLPFNIYSDFDGFIGDNIDHFYAQFVQFWGEHSLFKPCAPIRGHEKDSYRKCLIVDGHMKIRRRICSNPTTSLTLPALDVFTRLLLIHLCVTHAKPLVWRTWSPKSVQL
jgi:hypothetical protein